MWRINKSRALIGTGAIAILLIPSAAMAATQISSTICPPLTEPTITAPSSNIATTSSTIQIVGTAGPGKVVTLKKNNVGAGAVTTTSNGTYALEAPLDQGENQLVAHTSNECNTSKQSATLRVQRTVAVAPKEDPPATPTTPQPTPITKQHAPEIIGLPTIETLSSTPAPTPTPQPAALPVPITATEEDQQDNAVTTAQKEVITKPHPGETVKTERMWVKGKAKPDSIVSIYINKVIAAQVLAATDGAYGTLVSLKPGNNTVLVKATAQDGKPINRVVNVQLVKATTEAEAEAGTNNQPTASDTVAKVIIGALAVGGVAITAAIVMHMPHMPKRGKLP